MKKADFKPGFRLSLLDAVILASGGAAAYWCYSFSSIVTFAIVFVVGHFFLFCNLVRMSRVPELVWAAFFTALSVSHYRFGWPAGEYVLASTVLLTLVLVVVETSKPSYHGVLWKKLNPNLEEWFKETNAGKNT